MKKPLYLDWAATAPLTPAARAAVDAAAGRLQLGEWGNPSSVHAVGRAARKALGDARDTIAGFLKVPADSIIFTSGGTEALWLALTGADASEILVGATEHPAVLQSAADATRIAVDADGRVVLPALPKGALVAVQQANNETGVVQDMAALARAVHDAGGRLLADCVQSAGKMALPTGADFIAVSAHKLGGPAGIGALVARCKDGLRPVRTGGGQEQGWRGGTENLLGIIGFAAAVEAWDTGFPARAEALQRLLEDGAIALGARVNGAGAERLPTISSLHLPGVSASTQLMALDMAGVAVSQGSACSSGTLKTSPTLEAMGLGAAAGESLRVSIGWTTSEDDIRQFLGAYAPLALRAKRHAA